MSKVCHQCTGQSEGEDTTDTTDTAHPPYPPVLPRTPRTGTPQTPQTPRSQRGAGRIASAPGPAKVMDSGRSPAVGRAIGNRASSPIEVSSTDEADVTPAATKRKQPPRDDVVVLTDSEGDYAASAKKPKKTAVPVKVQVVAGKRNVKRPRPLSDVIVVSSDSEAEKTPKAGASSTTTDVAKSITGPSNPEWSHDERRMIIRVAIWTNRKEDASIDWQILPLGRTTIGRLVEGLQLPKDTLIELWEPSTSSWEGRYHQKSTFWVRQDRKRVLGRVIGSGEVGMDFWKEMQMLQSSMATTPFDWLLLEKADDRAAAAST
ncbi:hypothetical protein CERSUDRAFT_101229 [Gelatoporia subvermispora B]|uniref:Uncharacterized protein n=1 Tax=Ceriporiopsis subvermispora (strain B) TaxID=914234 RepID=M2QEX6_CERS8|nr:hypothetical protein CERSUDRAFT_101229 [Gelatoporia subvermispora B]